MLLLAGVLALQLSSMPSYVLKGYTLPAGLPVTHEQVLEWFVPEYARKRSRPQTFDESYEAAVLYFRRTNLGLPGEDFLVVAILEIDRPCEGCRRAAFGIVDLKRRQPVGGWYNQEHSLIYQGAIAISKRGAPWKVAFISGCCPRPDSTEDVEWRLTATLVREPQGAFSINFAPVIETRIRRSQ